jgi:ATP-dependent exoDNAse (exonuclease V) beta subunit
MLRDTYLRRPEHVEEQNLYYVAVTRAKRELSMVYGVR